MSVLLWNSLVLTWEWSQHTTNFDFCISVIPQWEQHQQSRTHSWELHQSVCCWPLQPCQLWWLFRIGCACKHGVLPADQLHPETGPLPQPAEPKPPQRHMTTWFVSLSAIRGPESLKDVRASHAHLLHSALPTHLQLLWYLTVLHICGERPAPGQVGYLERVHHSKKSKW